MRSTIAGLAREALLPVVPDEDTVQAVGALLDFSTFRSFVDRDILKKQAANIMKEVLLYWINEARGAREAQGSLRHQPARE